MDGHQKLWTTQCQPTLRATSVVPLVQHDPRVRRNFPRVGRVLGTADATPLQFWTAVAPGSYLQLDDVVVTKRELPDREPVTIAGVVTQVRARHEGAQFDSDVFAIADGTLPAAGAGGRRDHHHPGRPRALRAAGTRRGGAPGDRRGARRRPALRPDGAAGPDGHRPRRRAGLPQRRLPRRHPRRARLDLRHLRRGHQDQLRHVPALLGVPVRRAGRRRRQRPRADLQRQGRGPALPRPPEHPARRPHPRGATSCSSCPASAVHRRPGLRAAAGR